MTVVCRGKRAGIGNGEKSPRVRTQLKPVCDDGCDVDCGEEVGGELVVARSNSSEILKAAEAPFDDVAPAVGPFVEAMDTNSIGFVGDYGFGAAFGDLHPQVVAIVAFVGKQSAHVRRERQNLGRSSNVGILARCQMKNDRPAKRIAQPMDFGRTPTTGAADRLIAFPPFPPEAQR